MTATIVDRLHEDFQALVALLDSNAEPSLRSTADDCFRKALLLAAASHFEARIINSILAFVAAVSKGDILTPEFVKRKALSRQYHTLFNWDANNANQFYGLFGERFRAFMGEQLVKDPTLEMAVGAFMEIGRERNRLVHQDFGSYSLEKTADEIFDLYKKGLMFVNHLQDLLRRCSDEDSS